jgi:hypothetical protein
MAIYILFCILSVFTYANRKPIYTFSFLSNDAEDRRLGTQTKLIKNHRLGIQRKLHTGYLVLKVRSDDIKLA